MEEATQPNPVRSERVAFLPVVVVQASQEEVTPQEQVFKGPCGSGETKTNKLVRQGKRK